MSANALFRVVLAAALVPIALGGCASGPSTGVEIVQWQQQQRNELEARGFPAYGPPGG